MITIAGAKVMSVSDNLGSVKLRFGRTRPCTPESAPFRSS
jgi:hypothetical protein